MAQLQRVAFHPAQFKPNQIALNPEQQHYLYKVLRLQIGDRFIAMNGQGQWWLAALTCEAAIATLVESLSINNELPVALTLIAAPPKGAVFEEVIRSATELGVTTIIPLISQRTILSPSPQKLERWRRIVREAAEQSHRQLIPILQDPIPFAHVQNLVSAVNTRNTDRFICSTVKTAPNFWQHLSSVGISRQSNGITLVTGPEGGWSQEEERCMTMMGYQPISLGRRILRAATAPITALSLIATYLEQDGL